MKHERHLYGLHGRGGAWRTLLRTPAAACIAVTAADAQALATLMHQAYRGTIDDEGDSPDESLTEMLAFFDGKYGPPIAGACVAIERDDELIAAALLCDWSERGAIVAGPLVAYVLVHPSARGQGHGIAVANAALSRLADARWGRVYAVITVGNLPSQALFGKLGFTVLD